VLSSGDACIAFKRQRVRTNYDLEVGSFNLPKMIYNLTHLKSIMSYSSL
jgi:hypothetical protein